MYDKLTTHKKSPSAPPPSSVLPAGRTIPSISPLFQCSSVTTTRIWGRKEKKKKKRRKKRTEQGNAKDGDTTVNADGQRSVVGWLVGFWPSLHHHAAVHELSTTTVHHQLNPPPAPLSMPCVYGAGASAHTDQ
ncbi:hypothetical protein GE21DRAFT_1222312 [Neurospora crassa]|nr:hypothetical protein B5O22.170 [imported] - Neurospora crassa [Neurospora crassa]KHE78869.1 hypothetical protein GE21DRAFT_1222312 [Neurospora crassa]